jgi:hypothetical protein
MASAVALCSGTAAGFRNSVYESAFGILTDIKLLGIINADHPSAGWQSRRRGPIIIRSSSAH